MRLPRLFPIFPGLLAGALLLGAPAISGAQSTDAAKPAAEEVRDPAARDARSIKDYTIEQRDEAVRKAKAALDDIDARLKRLEAQSREQWGRMDEAARQKSREAQADLRKKRSEAAEWYAKLKSSSKSAWEEVKKGFVKSYQDFREAFRKAPGKSPSPAPQTGGH